MPTTTCDQFRLEVTDGTDGSVTVNVLPPGQLEDSGCTCEFTIDPPAKMAGSVNGAIRLLPRPATNTHVVALIKCADCTKPLTTDIPGTGASPSSDVPCQVIFVIVMTVFTALGAVGGAVVLASLGIAGVILGTLAGIVAGLTIGGALSAFLCWLQKKIFG